MAIKYGFFDSVNGDRKYNADDISNYFLKLISNGVFATPSNAMQVQAGTGMTVSVSAGWAFINCKWINNDSPYNLTLDAADVVLNRIDRVVLRLDASTAARNVTIAIKKGTAGNSPVAPTLSRVSGGVWELSLARIYIAGGTTTITQAEITDERANVELCGWVTGLIKQIDTTNLFAQYNAAFDQWFSEIKETLTTTTLIRQYTSSYATTAPKETNIPINISQYNETIDVLNVYVNGLKLIQGVDYVKHPKYITLANALDVVGTSVEFEVLKSIDGSEAESIVDIVYQLQQEVGKMDNNVYFCNGVNDNVALMEYIASWEQGQTTKDTIKIVGTFGCNSATVTAADGKEYLLKYECSRGCGVTLDFSGCDVIDAPAGNFAYFSGCRITGLNVMYSNIVQTSEMYCITTNNAILDKCNVHGAAAGTGAFCAYSVTDSRLTECDANVTGAGTVWGIRGEKCDVTACKITVNTTGTNVTAYGVYISAASHAVNSWFSANGTGTGSSGRAGHNGGQFTNCSFYAKGDTAGVGFWVGNVSHLFATNCVFCGHAKTAGGGIGVSGSNNCVAFLSAAIVPLTSVSGYTQHNSVQFTTARGNYSGVFYKEPVIETATNFVSNGHIIANALV